MPGLASNSTILDAVMNELRIPTSNVTERAKIQRVVSNVYGDICSKADWWWTQRKTVVNTTPKITDGTVAVTENSTTLTFSTAPQNFSANVDVTNCVITIPGNAVDSLAVYRIISHTAGAVVATLDAAYTGTTGTAEAYRLYRVAYNLPDDVAKLTMVKRYGWREPLVRMGIEDYSAAQQINQMEGKPQAYSIYDFRTDDNVNSKRLLWVWPFPDLAYRMEVWYKVQQQADASTDLDLPIDYQQALIYGTLARAYAVFINDLERSAFFQALFNDVMALMAAQQREYASDKPGVAPVMDMYRRGTSRRRVGYSSLGRFFDIWPAQP